MGWLARLMLIGAHALTNLSSATMGMEWKSWHQQIERVIDYLSRHRSCLVLADEKHAQLGISI